MLSGSPLPRPEVAGGFPLDGAQWAKYLLSVLHLAFHLLLPKSIKCIKPAPHGGVFCNLDEKKSLYFLGMCLIPIIEPKA